MPMKFRALNPVLAIAALLALASPSLAQSYPNRAITMIVPFAPGGPADVLGRLIGQKMAEDLGQQVIIDNRPGANTIVGAQFVARAQPDGYTILLAIDGTLVMNPFLYSKLSYDPFKDFEPVAKVADIPSVLEANNNVPVKNVQDLINLAKAKPGELNVGVSTPTSQVTASLFNMMAGVNLVQVPYKGGTRLSLAPELPTVGETLPGFDLGIWQSVVAPAGTPKEIIARLYASLAKVLAMEDVKKRLLDSGIEPGI